MAWKAISGYVAFLTFCAHAPLLLLSAQGPRSNMGAAYGFVTPSAILLSRARPLGLFLRCKLAGGAAEKCEKKVARRCRFGFEENRRFYSRLQSCRLYPYLLPRPQHAREGSTAAD